MLRRAACFILMAVAMGVSHAEITEISDKSHRSRFVTTTDGLPCDDVQQVIQDSYGYIWLATRNGLARYDGFGMEVFRSNIRNGNILSSNNIKYLCEDDCRRLWIGTTAGLDMYDLQTGELNNFIHDEFCGNAISTMLCVSDGRLLIGSDQGLFEYFAEEDSVSLFTYERSGGVMPQTTVKSLFEDSRGNVWVGTWNEGLYRIDKGGIVYSYPHMNAMKSAHVVFEDSRHRIWVGSWGYGLFMLNNPYEPEKTTWDNFRHIPGKDESILDDIIYSISEDAFSGALWVGTRKGVSVLDYQSGEFTNICSLGTGHQFQEVTSLMTDRQGLMWVSTLGSGAFNISKRPSGVMLESLEAVKLRTGSNNVRCMLVSSDGLMWISIGSNDGLVTYNPSTGEVDRLDSRYRFAASSAVPFTVYSLEETSDGRILVGTYDGGLYVINRSNGSVDHFTVSNCGWLPGDRVVAMLEDSRGRLWLGCQPGLSVRLPDGSSFLFDTDDLKGIQVVDFAEGSNGSIWVATRNMGILRIDGSGTSAGSYSVNHYDPNKGNANTFNVTTVYNDATGRLWMGSDGMGLSLYDYRADRFEPVHMKWNLPGDIVAGILSDSQGALWVGSNMGLLRIHAPADSGNVSYRLYTRGDGAQDNIYNLGAVATDSAGRLFFGGPHGMNVIDGSGEQVEVRHLPVVITDVKIFGNSWHKLSDEVRRGISLKSPAAADKLTLDHSRNNFSIEFAVFDFGNDPLLHRYAYKLDGFDNEWHNADYSRRFAYYNNLPAGEYLFRVKATDVNGHWTGGERTLSIVINPPLWATWWAYLIYAILFFGVMAVIISVWRRRVRQRNTLRIRELELAQAEELNRVKLRFFTNITHEWLNPLSIITAVADEMKAAAPELRDLHRNMNECIGRLTSLLQQAIEFCKAEGVNQGLSGAGDAIAALAHRSVEPVDSEGLDFSSIDEKFLKKATDCVLAHMGDPDFSQAMFIDEMGISKSTLFRRLKLLTGLSYTAFVRDIRLKSACRIMKEKHGIRISELAYAVGFNDPKYFSLCFKKEFGMNPGEYMDSLTGKYDSVESAE